jgi:hypothetical protein
MSDSLQEILVGTMRTAGVELVWIVFALVAVLVLLAMFYFAIWRLGLQRGVNIRLEWNSNRDGTASQRVTSASQGATIENLSDTKKVTEGVVPSVSQADDLRKGLATIYKGMMLIGAIGLLLGAIWAYLASTPANGLMLVAFLLFGLSIIVFLSRDTGGLGCLNRFSASISGASAGVRLPSGVAAG